MNAQSSPSPVGVVLVTHTDYGSRLLKAAEFIIGPQKYCQSVSVDVTHEVNQTMEILRKALDETDQGSGVIICTDMFGGTPTNISLSLLGSRNLEVVTGVNLPMLIKILTARTKPLAQLAADAKTAGVQGIVVAGEVLRKKVSGE